MTSPGATTAAAPDTGAGPTVQLPVVDVRMQEFALPPVPDLGELTGIHIPPPPTPEEFFAGLPPLPALDLSALVSPLLSQMQLLGEGIIPGPWGTGGDADHAGAGGGLSGLFNLSEVLSESLSTGSSAMNALQGQWQGEGSESAKVTGEQIEADKNAVKTQGEQIAATVRVGAGIINHGNMLLKAVAARLATTLAALSPTAVTPGGQAAIVSAVAAATAEAEAIIATTEAELVPPTQTMLALAEPVPVRMPPGAEVAQLQKATQMARQVMEPVQQLVQQMGDPTAETAGAGLTEGYEPYSSVLPTGYEDSAGSDTGSAELDELFSDDLAAAWADEGTALPGMGGTSSLGAAAMLGAASTMGAAGAMSAVPAGAEAAPAAARAATAGSGQPAMMPPPMGAGAGARGGNDDAHKTPEFLVTAAHCDEVVGDQPDVAPGVLGGAPHPGPAWRDDDGVDSTRLSL